jgi:hypothetical protein
LRIEMRVTGAAAESVAVFQQVISAVSFEWCVSR